MEYIKRIGLFLVVNFLVIVVIGFILSLLGIDSAGVTGLLIMSVFWGMGGSFISLLISKWMAKKAYSIKIIEPSTSSGTEGRIYSMIKRLAEKNNLPVPEVGIYNSPEPNAFATGATKKSSMVAFSTGLLNMMDERRIEAVAGHEMAHIKNGDMVTLTLLTGIANAFVIFISRFIVIFLGSATRNQSSRGGLGALAYPAVVFIVQIVLMLLANIVLAAFSRRREYRADEGSARTTSPDAMASALATIGGYTGQLDKKDSFTMAKIDWKKGFSLFRTHPPIEDRIKRLKEMTIIH
ncbi:MAG: protease HtpX [Ignavibacteria bacterium]|nr:protease HtpX [Ignavibacteria bacterium]